jgi:serine/threonine protein kinase/Tol biopolymer transport system component
MALSAGTRLGPYEILAPIGAGGMGEVYRARDTKLKREVALKVLPEAFAGDQERMARFQREAEVLASLNHPNIAHIYGVEERALAMELVEGETLSNPLSIETARNYARQIAGALEYAHEKGVVHRDLKPANVKVTPEGVVKLLDLGLAKAIEDPVRPGDDPTNSPTLTLGATRIGVIMGTAAYMSPEQAGGKPVDRRADIWSFGAVLYEMLSGKKAFEGESVSDTLASVLKVEPDWDGLPSGTPPAIGKLVRRCLTKDRKQRLQAIGEARITLDNPTAEESAPVTAPLQSWLGWTVAGVLTVLSAALGFVTWKHVREEPPPVAKLFFPLPNETFDPGRPGSTAISPDGRRVAIACVVDGMGELWVRDLDNPAPRILPADGASGMPFWAPDSRRLGFFAEGKLKMIDITGGPAVTIADAERTTGGMGPWNGSWNKDDVVVFGRITSPLFRVSAAGGSPALLMNLDETRQETAHFAPWFLPDGHHFLYVALSTNPEKRGIYVADLAAKTRKQVMIESTRTIYAAPGYLLFSRDRTLMAQPFDTGKLETTGEAVPVAEQMDVNNAGVGVAAGYFSASQNGVLVYTSGRSPAGVQLTWFDRMGKKLDTAGAPGDVGAFSLSLDGTRVALTRRDPQVGRYDLWIRDLARGAESRLSSDGMFGFPVWSADGTHIFYGSRPVGTIFQKAANNTGAEEVVEVASKQPMDASRDGRFLFTVTPGINRIWVLPLFGDRKPYPYVQTDYQENQPRLSPDGRWLAYRSNESKRNEIFVVSFPQPGGKWQISTSGGQAPVWSRDGRELFYYSADNKIMAVEIKPGAQFQFGAPKALFEKRISTLNTSFGVSRDGRFLLPALVEQEASKPMAVVLNWPEMLKKK